MNRDAANGFKWVGTRPVRPDGVDKVTGRARFAADLSMPGMLNGLVLRSPHAHARIRSIDASRAESLPGVKAVITSADLPDHPSVYVGPERVQLNFAHMTRNVMAREKALYEGHSVAAVAATTRAIAEEALSLIDVDYEVLPHVIDVDEAMRPDAPLLHPGHVHARRRPGPGPTLQRREAGRVRDRRRRGGVPRSGRNGRDGVHDPPRPPGLHRAARVRRALQRGPPGRSLGLESGALPDPILYRPPPRPRALGPAGYPGRDRRRFRRQDGRLPRADRSRSRTQERAAGQARDDSRGGVQGHRADLRRVHEDPARGDPGRAHHRGPGHFPVPGRRVPRVTGAERLHVRVRPLLPRERAHRRVRRGVQPSEVGRLSRSRFTHIRVRGGKRHGRARAQDRDRSARAPAAQRGPRGHPGRIWPEVRLHRVRGHHRGAAESPALPHTARTQPGTRRRFRLLVQQRRRVERHDSSGRGRDRGRRDRQPGHRRLAGIDGDHGGRNPRHRLRESPAHRGRHRIDRVHRGYRRQPRHPGDRARGGGRGEEADRRAAATAPRSSGTSTSTAWSGRTGTRSRRAPTWGTSSRFRSPRLRRRRPRPEVPSEPAHR